MQPASEVVAEPGGSTGSSRRPRLGALGDADAGDDRAAAPRRRGSAAARAEAVEVKRRPKAKPTRADAKAKPEAKAEPDATAEPAAKAEPLKFGRRKNDRLDALQALQEEMSAAAGDRHGARAAAHAV